MPASPLDPFRERAREVLAGVDGLGALLAEAEVRSAESAALRESVPRLCRLVAAHARGEYADADEDEVELALAAVLYVGSPWDQAPDYLPGGLRDDEMVTRGVVLELERALRDFENWLDPPARRPRRRV